MLKKMDQVQERSCDRKCANLYRIRSHFIVGTMIMFAFSQQQVESAPTSISHVDTEEQQGGVQTEGEKFTGSKLQASETIRAIHYHFDQKMEPFMKLHKLNSTDENSNTVTCNDGSPIGYYKRLNSHSKSWIIYLQGGGFCGGEEACQHRWRHSPHLMSSNYWPKLKSVAGILSSEPKDNPYLWNANHIYVPYCSSDSWTGLQEARTDRAPSFTFMGSRIIEKVLDSLFDDLPPDSSLFESKFILLAGDSAGATGVILNLDKVNRLVQQRISASNSSSGSGGGSGTSSCAPEGPLACESSPRQMPVVRGLADSGWFLDNEPYDYSSSLPQDWPPPFGEDSNEVDCDRQRCTPLQSIKQAMSYWNGQVPAACASKQFNEPWRCYFAYRAYQTLKTPLFVVQWLYDEAQLMLDNIIRPGSVGQWNYVNRLVNEMRQSLENVTALFAPSCFSHSLIIKQTWNQININGFKLPHILNSWEEEVLSNQPTLESLDQLEISPVATQRVSRSHQVIEHNQASMLSTEERVFQHTTASLTTIFEPRTTQLRSSINNNNNNGNLQAINHVNPRPKGRKKRRNNLNSQPSSNGNRLQLSTNRLSRSTSFLDDTTTVLNNNVPDVLLSSVVRQQEGVEKFRLIDTCGWPQCNRDCPYLDQELNIRPLIPY